ncbi:MAG: glycosyltransferase family 9 protein [Candidatus Krumholzibacteriia bacterium]
MSWTLDGRPLRRVLVTRLRYLGDIAMSTVVLSALRRGDPDLELDYLCEANHAVLLAGHPHLAGVHSLATRRRGADARARVGRDRAGSRDPGAPDAVHRGSAAIVRDLRRRHYDAACDLFFNPRSAWLLRLAGIPRRLGGAAGRWRARLYTHTTAAPTPAERPRFRTLAPGGLGDHLARLAPLMHQPSGLSFLDWCEQTWPGIGPATLVALPPRPAGELAGHLSACGADPAGGYVVLAPGATWASKEWPVQRWRELVSSLSGITLPLVVLSPPGGAGPYGALARDLAGRGGVLPPLPLAHALQVVGASHLVVSVDGGIMHAAVAMNRPTVALFGPTAPEIWFPYEDRGPYRVVATRPECHPCDRHACDAFVCLPDLTAERVARAVTGLLADAAGRSRP